VTGTTVQEGYIDRLIRRLNVQRVARQEAQISKVLPSDFRDIFARWVHIQSGGSLIAVMFALGHSSLRSTNVYFDNVIFSAENDASARRFMTHLFEELEEGRVDLTILAQLVRNGQITSDMQARLVEYRGLMRSRLNVGCADQKKPSHQISFRQVKGTLCGTHHCLRFCAQARFLPESLDGIAMRVEELMFMSDFLPFDTWRLGGFENELQAGEFLLADLYPTAAVDQARARWRDKMRAGQHVVPGVGILHSQEVA